MQATNTMNALKVDSKHKPWSHSILQFSPLITPHSCINYEHSQECLHRASKVTRP